jgi:hypothetical protein
MSRRLATDARKSKTTASLHSRKGKLNGPARSIYGRTTPIRERG